MRTEMRYKLSGLQIQPDMTQISRAIFNVTCDTEPRSTIAVGGTGVVSATPDVGFDMAACLDRVRARDEAAARALVDHLYPLVIRIVRSHLPRRTPEEDLMQTVFMKLFSKLEQYRGQVPFEHWVARVAVNTCLNQLQSEKIRPELRMADLSEDEAEVLETIVSRSDEIPPDEAADAREIVVRLLETLKPKDRLLLSLLHLEGRTIEEIRAITGWNASVIKVRAFRARLQLRKRYRQLVKTYEIA